VEATDCFKFSNTPNSKNTKLLFTGDTLFVNGIGRPDLRDKAKEFASLLYYTLHRKIFILHKHAMYLLPIVKKNHNRIKSYLPLWWKLRKKSQ
jgi:hypothetical protein